MTSDGWLFLVWWGGTLGSDKILKFITLMFLVCLAIKQKYDINSPLITCHLCHDTANTFLTFNISFLHLLGYSAQLWSYRKYFKYFTFRPKQSEPETSKDHCQGTPGIIDNSSHSIIHCTIRVWHYGRQVSISSHCNIACFSLLYLCLELTWSWTLVQIEHNLKSLVKCFSK